MEYKKCPKCNSDVESENRFCGKCGFDFGEILDQIGQIPLALNQQNDALLQDKQIESNDVGNIQRGEKINAETLSLASIEPVDLKQKQRHKKMYYKISVIAGVLLVAFIVLYVYYIIPEQKYIEDLNGYNKAVADINNGQLDDALNNLKLIGNFKDAQELINKAMYQEAINDITNNQYDDALKILNQLGAYKDSQNIIKQINIYQNALTDIKANKLDDSLNSLNQVKEFANAVSLIDIINGFNDDVNKKDYYAALNELNNNTGLFSSEMKLYENPDFVEKYSTELINSNQYDKAENYLSKYGSSSPDYAGLYNYAEYLNFCQMGIGSGSELEEYVSPEYSGPYAGTIKNIVLNYLYNQYADLIPGLTQDDEMGFWAKDYQNTQSPAPAKQEPAIGMTADEVRNSSWGSPEEVNKTITADGDHEQWVYSGNRYIYVDNGVVSAIQD